MRDGAGPAGGTAPRQQNLARAIAWMIAVLLSFTMVAIAGRESARGIGTIELMWWRAAIGVSLLLIGLLLAGGRVADSAP
jgi:cytochrome b561